MRRGEPHAPLRTRGRSRGIASGAGSGADGLDGCAAVLLAGAALVPRSGRLRDQWERPAAFSRVRPRGRPHRAALPGPGARAARARADRLPGPWLPTSAGTAVLVLGDRSGYLPPLVGQLLVGATPHPPWPQRPPACGAATPERILALELTLLPRTSRLHWPERAGAAGGSADLDGSAAAARRSRRPAAPPQPAHLRRAVDGVGTQGREDAAHDGDRGEGDHRQR